MTTALLGPDLISGHYVCKRCCCSNFESFEWDKGESLSLMITPKVPFTLLTHHTVSVML